MKMQMSPLVGVVLCSFVLAVVSASIFRTSIPSEFKKLDKEQQNMAKKHVENIKKTKKRIEHCDLFSTQFPGNKDNSHERSHLLSLLHNEELGLTEAREKASRGEPIDWTAYDEKIKQIVESY